MQLPAFSPSASLLRIAAFIFALLLMTDTRVSAATWSGASTSPANDLWSNLGNWNTPPAGAVVAFGDTDAQATSATINNVIGTSISIATLSYLQTGGLWQNTEIASGQTLTITTVSSAPLIVGSGTSSQTNVSLSGAGTFSVSSTSGTIQVGSGTNNAALLDMSGLAVFSANLGTGSFNIGSGGSGAIDYNSTVKFAASSTLTAGSLNMGGVANTPGTQTLSLGSATNVLNVGTLSVGGNNGIDSGTATRSSGALNFNGPTGSVTLRGSTGGSSRADVNLINGNSIAGANLVSTVNLLGHSADLMIDEFTMARRTSASTSGNATATFSFDTGTLDVTSIFMAGREQVTASRDATATLNLGSSGSTGTSTIGSLTMANNTQSTGTALATLNVAGGSHTVEGNITLSAASTSGGIATSVINLTGGTFTVEGNIAEGTGSGTRNSTITLDGGTFDMDGGSITVDTFNVRSGTLRTLGEFNSGATLTKTTSGTLTLDGANTYTGNTAVSGGTLIVTGSIASAGTYSVASSTKLQVGNNTATGSLGSGTIANAGTVEFNRNNALSFGNAISGAGNVVQNGSGVTTFSATHSYTGSTQVNVGTLLVNGSIASSSGVSVAAGATLGGSGSVSALSGAGTIAPGNSPGILTAPSVDGTNGLDFFFELTALAPDYENASASLNDVLRLTSGTPFVASLGSGNTVTVDFSSLSLSVGQTYFGGFYADAGDFWSSISGANFVFNGASGFTIAVSTVQQNADFASGSATGWITQFDVIAIPEPSTTLLLTGGLMALVLFRRRRRY